jgi:hypothetical protein
MTVEYTIEQFIEEFEEAQTPDAKQEVMLRLLDSDIDLVDNKELLIEYKAQIQDLKEQISIEEDIKINDLIENGSMELYTCTKIVNEFVEGNRYYVQIDDVKSKYTESFERSYFYIPDSIKEYVENIKPLIWIITDNGIGSLKYKVLVTDFDFSEHFTKA